MSFLKKIFGQKPQDPNQPAVAAAAQSPVDTEIGEAPEAAPADPAVDPNLMRVTDPYGREMFITREEWRDNVLRAHLEKVWSDAEQLYLVIVQALRDGFAEDVLAAAEQLARIDPVTERGHVILAVVLRELKRLDDSERVLRGQIVRQGESAVIQVNLAKIQAERGQTELASQTLWRSLELDPNLDAGFGWYLASHREQGGEIAALEALRRVAALPGSWRARLWLARDSLERRETDAALDLYDEALALSGNPAPADLLMQLGGDLGSAGLLNEMLERVVPRFDIGRHGLAVGNNILKAAVELGRLEAARELLDALYAVGRSDWKPHLAFWDAEIAKARIAAAPKGPVSVAMLVDDGPAWLPPQSPAGELFPAPEGEVLRIAFLGSTAEVVAAGEKATRQMTDAPGRFSRTLPLFLAEQIRFAGRARVRPMVPWLQGEAPAFVVRAHPWTVEEAVPHAGTIEPACEYVVVTHLQAVAAPWRAELRLIRVADSTVVGTASAEFDLNQPEEPIRGLADELLALLQREAGLASATPAVEYRVPAGRDFGHYLLRLEQLLTVRCNTMKGVPPGHLHGERDIVDGLLLLCLSQSDNVVPRLMLVEALTRLRVGRPQVVAEYREKVRYLHKEKALPEPAQSVVDRLLATIFP